MRCRKVRQVLRYHVPNNFLYPEKLPDHVLLLFCLFRDEKELLSSFPPTYQNKLLEKGVEDVVNISQIKFELYGDLVDQTYSQYNETLISNQDQHN